DRPRPRRPVGSRDRARHHGRDHDGPAAGERHAHQPEGEAGHQMKAVAVRRSAATATGLEGRIACPDVRAAAGKVAIEKGQVLDGGAAERLLALPWNELHLLEVEPGDVHEEPAGARLSAAAAGEGVEIKGYAGGQWTLAATRRGLVRVRVAALDAVNQIEGMSVFTLYDLQPVDAGEVVARAKITPLAMPEVLVKQ